MVNGNSALEEKTNGVSGEAPRNPKSQTQLIRPVEFPPEIHEYLQAIRDRPVVGKIDRQMHFIPESIKYFREAGYVPISFVEGTGDLTIAVDSTREELSLLTPDQYHLAFERLYSLMPVNMARSIRKDPEKIHVMPVDSNVLNGLAEAVSAPEQIDVYFAQQKMEAEERSIIFKSYAVPQKIVDSTLRWAITNKASDVHFEPYEGSNRIRVRIDGSLVNYPGEKKIDDNTFRQIVTVIKNRSQ